MDRALRPIAKLIGETHDEKMSIAIPPIVSAHIASYPSSQFI